MKTNPSESAKSADNESLYNRLKAAAVLEEFMELMFAHEHSYEELLEELEKWSISSSLGALSRFKASHKGEWSMQRALREQKDFLAAHGADLDEVTRQMTAVNIFNIAANPNTAHKDVLKMRDQEIKLAAVRQNDERLRQNERRLAQQDELIEMQKRKIEALEAQARQAAEKLDELRDPAKADDPAMRQRILDEVDRAMGIKKTG